MGSIARKLTRTAPCSVLLLLDPSEKEKPTQHIVVNAFESVNDKKTVSSSLIFANSFNVPKVTLVEEINSLNLNLSVYDDVKILFASLGMNVLVAIGFWLDWKQYSINSKKEDGLNEAFKQINENRRLGITNSTNIGRVVDEINARNISNK